MQGLPITSLYAGLLGLLLLVLSMRVVQARLAGEVSLGDGGNEGLLVAQRRQGNFIEYVPLAVVLIALAESNGSAPWLLHALGATLVVSRIAHPFGLATEFGLRPPRFLGTIGTFGVVGVASLLAIWSFFGGA